MDFKFREKNGYSNGFKAFDSGRLGMNVADDPFRKYSVKGGKRGVEQRGVEQGARNKEGSAPMKAKSNISRYFRSERAPKSQFKRYMSDVKNVFYEDRQSLMQMQYYNTGKWISGILWVLLLLSYAAMSVVKPYEGKCPDNAKCGAFVNCYTGFEYSQARNECVLSGQLLDQIESVCALTIERIRYEWGGQDCQGIDDDPEKELYEPIPKFKLSHLFLEIENGDLIRQLRQRMQAYLSSPERQKSLGFEYQPTTNIIYPTSKLYSLSCRLHLFIRTKTFKLGLSGLILIFSLASLAIIKIRKFFKAKHIYQELKERTLKTQSLNVSYAKEELEKTYGKIDEELWSKVDENRTQDRQIGYFQDDFLYWQLL